MESYQFNVGKFLPRSRENPRSILRVRGLKLKVVSKRAVKEPPWGNDRSGQREQDFGISGHTMAEHVHDIVSSGVQKAAWAR